MNEEFLNEMLLIKAPAVMRYFEEIKLIAGYFIPPMFLIGVVVEFFSDLDFVKVIKKLIIVVLFINFFYEIHTYGSDLALKVAGNTLERVNPGNIFLSEWYMPKTQTQSNESWGWVKEFAIPNLNDLIATSLYVMAQIFLWLLKLIYSAVYHFSYVFSGVTALLYFLGWTSDALKGNVQASIWCMVYPFIVVAILALVGTSMEASAMKGEVAGGSIDQLIWLFGVTLLLLASPMMAYGMVKGEGIHAFGGKLGQVGMMGITHFSASIPALTKSVRGIKSTLNRGINKFRAGEGDEESEDSGGAGESGNSGKSRNSARSKKSGKSRNSKRPRKSKKSGGKR